MEEAEEAFWRWMAWDYYRAALWRSYQYGFTTPLEATTEEITAQYLQWEAAMRSLQTKCAGHDWALEWAEQAGWER